MWWHAIIAIVRYRTSIGLRGTDGVVFAVEKLVTSKLYEPGANRRLFNIDKHIGMAIGGLLADARQIVERARHEASNYRGEYKGDVPLKVQWVDNLLNVDQMIGTIWIGYLMFALFSAFGRQCCNVHARPHFVQCCATVWVWSDNGNLRPTKWAVHVHDWSVWSLPCMNIYRYV